MGSGIDNTVKTCLILAVVFGSVTLLFFIFSVPYFKNSEKSKFSYFKLEGEMGNLWGFLKILRKDSAILTLLALLIGPASIVMLAVPLCTNLYSNRCYMVLTFVVSAIFFLHVFTATALDQYAALHYFGLEYGRHDHNFAYWTESAEHVAIRDLILLSMDFCALFFAYPFIICAGIAMSK